MRQRPGIQIVAMGLMALLAAVMVWLALAQLTAKRAEELQASAQPQGRPERAGPLSAPLPPPAARTAIPPDAPEEGDDRVVFLELHGPRPGHSALVKASAARAQVGADGSIPFPSERTRAGTGATWVLSQGRAPTRVPRVEPGAAEPESLELKRGATLELRIASAPAEATLGVELFPDPPMGLPQELHATVGRVCALLSSAHRAQGERSEELSEPEFNALLRALERDDRLVLERLSAVLNGARSLPCGGRIWRGLSDGMRYRLRYTSEDFTVVPSASGEGLAVMPDGGFAVSSKAFTSPSNVSGEIRLGVDEHRVLTTSAVAGAAVRVYIAGLQPTWSAYVAILRYETIYPRGLNGPGMVSGNDRKTLELLDLTQPAVFPKVAVGDIRPLAAVLESKQDIWFLDSDIVSIDAGELDLTLRARGSSTCRIELSGQPHPPARTFSELPGLLRISLVRTRADGRLDVAHAFGAELAESVRLHGLGPGEYTLRLQIDCFRPGVDWNLQQRYAALSHEEKFRIDSQTREVLVKWSPTPD